MKLAQMEGFQWILDSINQIQSDPQRGFTQTNYQLLFSYKDILYTGEFFKTAAFPDNIEFFKEKVRPSDGFHYFEKSPLKPEQLLYKLSRGQELQDFYKTTVGYSNIKKPEFTFYLISEFIGGLDGSPVTPYIYNLKQYSSDLILTFIKPDEDAEFTPVSLINREASKN
ncbi:hypothetical protein [Lentilactobacillus hilgardii]|uniref:hypothetical protein n=1 Tax=Lentilactobacillus hilgardii TaxID=1588 RepID=UPI0021A86FE3|nr:hypothetical protein [Lentilactobacillus hilgardii]MCT3395553.1 hypothetical protein [Lentilactobacillus hilgardii]